MFLGCHSLKSIDLSSFTTNNVKNMELMFSSCMELESIDLSKFNTIKCLDAKILLYLMQNINLFKKK